VGTKIQAEGLKMEKNWTGNSHTTYAVLGASDHSDRERETNDYYATDPKALELFLDIIDFPLSNNIWECACGEGHLSKVLIDRGYTVKSTDIIDRGFGNELQNFLSISPLFGDVSYDGDILTNPPYKFAQEFVEKALEIVKEDKYVIMFLKIQFLEGKKRKKLFEVHPPKYVYISSSRLDCSLNGQFTSRDGSAVAYAWYVWQKGYRGDPVIKWFN